MRLHGALSIICVGATVFFAQAADVIVTPQENPTALRNPLKGFRDRGNTYSTFFKAYIPWNQLENVESDGIDKIRAYGDANWNNLGATNMKVMPRVWLDYPGRPSGWPSDLPGDYNSAQFRQRVVRLIERMGEAWDSDPRVAWVETGIAYNWGEGSFNGALGDAVRDAFIRSFKKKHWMSSACGRAYEPSTIGGQWDSFGHPDQKAEVGMWLNLRNPDGTPRWTTAPMQGEVAYDWGGFLAVLGANPTATMSTPAFYNRIVNYIYLLHSTGEGWVAGYSRTDATVTGSTLSQKAFGYRFVLDTLVYPATVQAGQPFSVSFAVRNVASCPFYYQWPVQVALLNKTTHAPVWTGIFAATDIRKWLPGSDWSNSDLNNDAALATLQGRLYLKPAVRYHETGSFTVPSTVASGEYVLALAIPDPDGGMLPSVRFAINNYWQGGYHPMGIIGVGTTPASTAIDASTFFTDFNDATLHYIVPSATVVPSRAPGTTVLQSGSLVLYDLRGRRIAVATSGLSTISRYRQLSGSGAFLAVRDEKTGHAALRIVVQR